MGCVLLSTIDQTAGRVLSACYETLHRCYRQKCWYIQRKKSHLNPHVCLTMLDTWFEVRPIHCSIWWQLLKSNLYFCIAEIISCRTTRWNPSNVVKSYPISKKLVILYVKKNLLGLHPFLPFPINRIKCPGLISLDIKSINNKVRQSSILINVTLFCTLPGSRGHEFWLQSQQVSILLILGGKVDNNQNFAECLFGGNVYGQLTH